MQKPGYGPVPIEMKTPKNALPSTQKVKVHHNMKKRIVFQKDKEKSSPKAQKQKKEELLNKVSKKESLEASIDILEK